MDVEVWQWVPWRPPFASSKVWMVLPSRLTYNALLITIPNRWFVEAWRGREYEGGAFTLKPHGGGYIKRLSNRPSASKPRHTRSSHPLPSSLSKKNTLLRRPVAKIPDL